MSNDYIIEKGEPAAHATFGKAWPRSAQNVASDFALTREYFFHLLKTKSPNDVAQWKDHPFWINWRSKKTGANILSYAAAHAPDPSWIEALVAWGVDINTPETPSFSPIFRRSSKNKEPSIFLKAFLKAGCRFEVSGQNSSVLRHIVNFGSLDDLLVLHQASLIPSVRENDIEHTLLRRKNFVDRSRGQTLSQALEIFFDAWGVPDVRDLRGMQSVSLEKYDRDPSAEKFLWQHFNPSTPLWDRDHDDMRFILASIFWCNGPILQDKTKDCDNLLPKNEDDWQEVFNDLYEGGFDEDYVAKLHQVYLDVSAWRSRQDLIEQLPVAENSPIRPAKKI